MGVPIIQPSFAAGELAPSLWSRVDLAKYHVGAALLRNFFVDYRGGVANRAGTRFVNQVFDSSNVVRLIPFQFSTLQTYVLEFGHLYMRVIMNGAHVLEPTLNITGVTNANPCVVTLNAHGYANGDWVFIDGVGGMTQLNGKYFKIIASTLNTFTLGDVNGTAINSTAYGVYTAGGTSGRVFKLTTTYTASDLALLKFVQSADTMTLVHKSYVPRNLTRTQHYAWTLTDITFVPTQAAPNITSVTASTAGGTGYTFVVTAISADGTEESVASNAVNVASATMSTTGGAYCQVTWTAPAGPQPARYNIYRTDENAGVNPPLTGSVFGYVGSAAGNALSFIDQNTLPDLTNAPPTAQNPFAAANNPGCVTYYQARRFYAGSTAFPQTLWGSRTNNFGNMNTTFPSKDTDALTISILSQQVNAIQFMIPLTPLLVFTRGGAWKLSSGGTGTEAISPTAISADPQVYNGCSDRLPPIVINYDILYAQAKGSIVRDLAYNLYLNTFTGTDLTILSNHLFTGYTLLEWAWAEEPHKIVWAVRNDGALLGFTYLKEQDVYAWTRHDTTNGLFESVASISEGAEDAVYFVVRRFINGRYVRYIERLNTRNFNNAGIPDVSQAFFVDCGLRNTLGTPAATVTPSATTTSFAVDNVVNGTILITADANVFTAGDVGKVIRLNGGRGTVTAFVDAKNVQVKVLIPLVSIWPAASGSWTYTTPITTVTNLDHLEGQTVSILADGGKQGARTVVNGTVTLDIACADVIIGLPIQAQLQSLYLDAGGTPTIQGKQIGVNACTIRVVNSRGLKVGNSFDTVVPFKERGRTNLMGTPIDLITGDERMPLDPLYRQNPQVCVQQDDPLPAQILALIPEITVAR